MWTETLARYLTATDQQRSAESLLAIELIAPESYSEQLPRINGPYAHYFGPYDQTKAQYPLSRLGSYSRFDRHYLPRWVDLKALLDNLLPAVDLSACPTPLALSDLVDAVGLIGSLTYSAEWVSDPETVTDLDNDASAPDVFDANDLLATDVAQRMRSRAPRTLHVLDIGVGRGNTILPVLEQLARSGVPRVEVSLLDISSESLNKTAGRIERAATDPAQLGQYEMGLEVHELLQCNLVELGRTVVPRTDRYDLIVSGGALFHSTDKERIFTWAHRSLRPDGLFIFWDWFAPCWAAPNLVAGGAGYVAEGLYEMSPDEAAAVEQTWLHGWLGQAGYFNYWDSADNDQINADFDHHMSNARTGVPFSFVSWLGAIADAYAPPARPGHYLCIEGYTAISVYLDDSAAAGLEAIDVLTLDELKRRHRVPARRIDGTNLYRDTIKMIVLERGGA